MLYFLSAAIIPHGKSAANLSFFGGYKMLFSDCSQGFPLVLGFRWFLLFIQCPLMSVDPRAHHDSSFLSILYVFCLQSTLEIFISSTIFFSFSPVFRMCLLVGLSESSRLYWIFSTYFSLHWLTRSFQVTAPFPCVESSVEIT